MEKITLEFIADAVHGIVANGIVANGAVDISGTEGFTEISTDTRSIIPGCLFIALRGERFDGNNYLEEAFDKGAAACLAEKPCDKGTVIVVGDTGAALLALAGAYRKLFDIPVIGITGSVGKTSTKEMICCVLSQRFKTLKNEGNRNNGVGMPLSVFSLTKEHRAAVFEMGMNSFGEISRLSLVAQPDLAVITNIGISHIEKLGSQENILKAKLEITDGLKPDGKLVVNGDDRMLKGIDAGGRQILTYGIENDNCGVFADNIMSDHSGTSFTIHYDGGSINAMLPVPGRHNVYNALAAFTCGCLLGIPPGEAVRGFENYSPTGLRQMIEDFSGITLIKDCYNASPDSMNSAFEVLKTVRVTGRRIAVLADMLELGKSSERAHRDVGKAAFDSGADMLLAYGGDAKYYCEGFLEAQNSSPRPCMYFGDKGALAAALAGLMESGDAVLFKGSRGMKLEEAIDKACERWNGK
jgi:UDP-N-acetylmuramoyl-tripeptide--D-alanyl-D-alanine ligase